MSQLFRASTHHVNWRKDGAGEVWVGEVEASGVSGLKEAGEEERGVGRLVDGAGQPGLPSRCACTVGVHGASNLSFFVGGILWT